MLSRKAKEHTENTEIKVNIDIFYELFMLKHVCQFNKESVALISSFPK